MLPLNSVSAGGSTIKNTADALMRPAALVFLFLTLLISSSAQTARHPRFYREEIYLVDTASGYYSKIVTQSETDSKKKTYQIPYSDLRKVSRCRISYFNEDGKLKKYREANLRDYSDPGEHFFSTDRLKCFDLPENGSFQVQYEQESKDIVLLSELLFMHQFPVDTFAYELHVPAELNLKYRLEHDDLLSFFSADSVFSKGQWTYRFTASSKNSSFKKPLNNTEYSTRQRIPAIRMIITPASYKGREALYFNRWLWRKYKPSLVLGEEGMKIADSLTRGQTVNDSVISVIFRFVRDKVRFLSIDSGFSGLVPDACTSVLKNRQGDCKAMANLLVQMLVYKGLNARLGLIGAGDHEWDFDFPSICSGNHVICVVECMGRWRFLDATQKTSTGQLPGGWIEGRTAFLLSDDLPRYVRIPVSSPELNREETRIQLACRNESFSGNYVLCCRGEAMQKMMSAVSEIKNTSRAAYMKKSLEESMKNMLVENPVQISKGDSCTLSCDMKLSPAAIFRNGKTSYISLDFLPRPLPPLNGARLQGDILFTHSGDKTVSATIDFGVPLKSCSFRPVDFSEGGFEFRMNASVEGNFLILRYHYSYPGIDLSFEKQEILISLDKILQTTFSNVVAVQ